MRIAIIWRPSSGKTTLAKDLYEQLKDEGYVLDIDTERMLADVLEFDFRNHTKQELLEYQRTLYKLLFSIHIRHKKLITDTPLINTLWYTPDTTLQAIVQAVSKCLYHIFLVCQPLPVKDDWVRHTDEEFLKEVEKKLLDYVEKELKNKPVVYLEWDRKERLKKALEAIKKYKK